MHLTANELKELRKLLEAERRGVSDALSSGTPNPGSGGHDSADLAVAEVSHELLWEIQERRSDRLLEIQDMLQRMGDGIYGFCERCGAGIPFRRLRALPSARRCLSCQQEADYAHVLQTDAARTNGRPAGNTRRRAGLRRSAAHARLHKVPS